MKFGTQGQIYNFITPALKLNNNELDFVENYNYLGVQLDQQRKFDKQKRAKGCSKALYIW